MRLVLCAAVLCVVMLAACTGASQPTATPVPPAAESTNSGVSDSSLATLAATLGESAAGTLVVPDEGETPNAPTRTPITLDSLYFTQTGGIAGITLTVELHGDGTLIRDGQQSTVNLADVQKIASQLDDIHFFDLHGTFAGPGSAADAYHYSLTVNTLDGNRTIMSDDGMTPPELNQLYDAIRSLGSDS